MVAPNWFFVLISEAWECFNNENNNLLCSQYLYRSYIAPSRTAPVITILICWIFTRKAWKIVVEGPLRGGVCVVVIYLLQKDKMMLRNDSDWFVSHSSDKASLQSETCQPASFSSFHLRQQPAVSHLITSKYFLTSTSHHLAVPTVITLHCNHPSQEAQS